MNQPLIFEQTRGPRVESRHSVHALWVDEKGREIKSWGQIDQSVCPRSSFKPFQVLPLVLSKGFEKSPNPLAAIAIGFASHSAEEGHVRFVREWLKILGLGENDLACAGHWPRDPDRIFAMARQNEKPDRTFNNCSGKHTGMLAACRHSGFATQGYHNWDHELQVRIRQIASRLSGVDFDRAPYGTDGCGLPIYYVPMTAFARMAAAYLQPEGTDFPEALRLVRQAWREHPIMVGGSRTLDTRLAQVTKGRVVAKIGAQGNYVAMDFERGRALVFKIESGADTVREQVLLDLLVRDGSLTAGEESELRGAFPREITNWGGATVGESRVVEPIVGIQKAGPSPRM